MLAKSSLVCFIFRSHFPSQIWATLKAHTLISQRSPVLKMAQICFGKIEPHLLYCGPYILLSCPTPLIGPITLGSLLVSVCYTVYLQNMIHIWFTSFGPNMSCRMWAMLGSHHDWSVFTISNLGGHFRLLSTIVNDYSVFAKTGPDRFEYNQATFALSYGSLLAYTHIDVSAWVL